MILSVHVIAASTGQQIAVLRHPIGVKPNALRHDVVFIAGTISRAHRLNGTRKMEELLAVARTWADARTGNVETLSAVPGYGLVDRLRRHKRAFADARAKKARLLIAMRKREDRRALEAEHGRKAVDNARKRWKKLRASYPRRKHQKRGGSRLTAGGSASKSLLLTLVKMAAKLKRSPTWEDLATIKDPPLEQITVIRYLDLLREVFDVKISETRERVNILDWGKLKEDRL